VSYKAFDLKPIVSIFADGIVWLFLYQKQHNKGRRIEKEEKALKAAVERFYRP